MNPSGDERLNKNPIGNEEAIHTSSQSKELFETPFDDLNGTTAASLFPFKFKYKFANREHLSRVNCKKLIIHGTWDLIIPVSSALRLKPLLEKEDQIIIIPKGRHKNLREFEIYHQKLKEFLLL